MPACGWNAAWCRCPRRSLDAGRWVISIGCSYVFIVGKRLSGRSSAIQCQPVPRFWVVAWGGDSLIATQGESADQSYWDRPTYIERDAGMYRAYYEVLDAGVQVLEYTVRINVPGDYQLPPTRVEALYQPDVFGSLPNGAFVVQPD
ncbi:hypothetical protein [Castellaniella sp.]|uniref:alpha-2-macroglobulin family protein n=1 Tax=Castellaniella sp. TaxID=1955812 RepID=UPI003A4C64C9